MKIKTVRISNFRSIANAEFDASGFNVFVGQNNHGKTNLLQAIEWFYSAKGDIGQIRNVSQASEAEVSVEIVFSGLQEGLGQITHADNQTKLRAILGNLDEMRVRRTSEAPKDRFIFHPGRGEWKKQPCGADSAFNNCIPRFEFVEATKNLKDDDERQRQSYSRLNDTLHTLGGAPIYRDKLVILLDQPDGPDKQARFDEFKRENRNLVTRGQLVELQVPGLEDYYPADLRAATGLGPNNKTKMARKVAATLTRERFETEMPLMFQALSTAWTNAYQD